MPSVGIELTTLGFRVQLRPLVQGAEMPTIYSYILSNNSVNMNSLLCFFITDGTSSRLLHYLHNRLAGNSKCSNVMICGLIYQKSSDLWINLSTATIQWLKPRYFERFNLSVTSTPVIFEHYATRLK